MSMFVRFFIAPAILAVVICALFFARSWLHGSDFHPARIPVAYSIAFVAAEALMLRAMGAGQPRP